jgi:hypothetical protein
MNTKPLQKYIESRELFKLGDEKQALALLADSLGASNPTPYMKSALKNITEPNIAILTIILHESKGKSNGR